MQYVLLIMINKSNQRMNVFQIVLKTTFINMNSGKNVMLNALKIQQKEIIQQYYLDFLYLINISANLFVLKMNLLKL